MSDNPFLPGTAGHHIAGAWVRRGPVLQSVDPATGEVIGDFHDAELETVREAISVARASLDAAGWRHDRVLRAKVLHEMADAVEERHAELLAALTIENGKIAPEAGFELSLCAPKLRYYAALALTDVGHAAEVQPGSLSMLVKEAAGVAGIIVPWNSPVILSIRSLAPALAAGCTAVVKMPAQTALTNALVADVLTGVPSLPAGVVNFFTEAGSDGARELVASRDTAVISYTGSTAVGSQIMADAAPRLKRVSLELGGKSPMVVFDDADLDVVVPTLTAAITTFAGQFCMTGSRILVHESIAETLRTRLATSLESVQVGPASDPTNQMGPMIDRASTQRVDALLDAAENVEFIVRGGAVEGPGAFFRPALVEVQDIDSPLIQQEVFGPVATFEVFTDEDEAISRANATDYGLAASVWTADSVRSLRVSMALEAGTVWTNTWGQVADQFEEGGYKGSGVGRLNGTGGLAEFQEVKHLVRPSR